MPSTSIYINPTADLASRWGDLRVPLGCPYGHFEKADVTSSSRGDAILTCTEKDCKAVWNLAGEDLTEEEQDDELTEAERLTPAGY